MDTCTGIDVSAYQAPQNWAALARDGLAFAFAKASEGQHSRDPRFAVHITGILAAGLIPGAYHYGWPNQSPTVEAANYVEAVRPFARPGFLHWLDLERRTDGANYQGATNAQIRAYATAWIAAVRRAFPGQRVGVYTSAADIAAGRMPGNADALWYPAYPAGAMTYAQAAARPRPAPSGHQPLVWQFTSTPVDRNLAYLSPAALRAWATNTTPQEHDVTFSQADAKTLLDTRIDDPTKPGADTVTVRGALWAGYGQAAKAAANTQSLLTQVSALTATVETLAGRLIGSGVDTAAVVAAVQAAIASSVVHVDVDVTGAQPTTS
ncbi:glycoside hydrolase family 25 protein [Actinacidiphila sp. ITFR-21]|uniref:glycoside hydrolase family 25 protein n=1 Tax=Actinacidiphila sp. ITFR-21 TaxID=3075199 RepID=UPI00288BD15B|nr:glycoside hydrolase family 25 protein [Streptomyces sp. ITFR-21]WNI16899.1 glycoside hydrolase family 25 protein [Streptomyces sp. ITFR-21]